MQWTQQGERGSAKITIPSRLARLIGPDRLFHAELHEDGILLRYVEGGEPITLPSWLT